MNLLKQLKSTGHNRPHSIYGKRKLNCLQWPSIYKNYSVTVRILQQYLLSTVLYTHGNFYSNQAPIEKKLSKLARPFMLND